MNATGFTVNGSTLTSSQWSNGSGNINYVSGNVGIGTNSPGSPLTVAAAQAQSIRMVDSATNGPYIAGYSSVAAGSRYGFLQFASGGSTISASTGPLQFYAGNESAERLRITSDGNVGIGTASPGAKLDVNGSIYSGAQIRANALSLLMWGTDAGGTNRVLSGSANLESQDPQGLELGTSSAAPVVLYTGASERLRIDASGNTTLTGNVSVSGNFAAKYQDLAEWVPSSEQLPTGTVVVLDSTKSNQVTSSSISYDTRVAGVVSEQPGIALGEKSEGKVLVATTGRVRVKVDASRSPIHIGDLLVTSDIPGVAMKSAPVNLGGVEIHRPGTLIGKALEPLEKGKGEILVLLSLQ